MISRWKWREHQPARPLSTRAIVLWAVFVLGIAVTSGAVLWCLYHDADPRVQLDAIRTGSAITVAAGGAVALLLAARRQRSTEETLEHQREVAAAAERDAAEQRITELYSTPARLISSVRRKPQCGSAVCTRWNGWRRTTRPNGRPSST